MTTRNFTQDRSVLKMVLKDVITLEEILTQIECIHDLASCLEKYGPTGEIVETRSQLLSYVEVLTQQMRGVISGGEKPCT
jgi:hypothetical protein